MKQKLTIALSSILVAFIIFWACQDDELPEPTAGVNNKVTFTQVSSDSVSYRVIDVSVSINNTTEETITDHGICYGTNSNPTFEGDKVQQGSLSGNTYTCSIENLEPNTTYHVRAYLKFREATAYSEDVIVKTKELTLPTIVTKEISNITAVSAAVSNEVINDGGSEVITRGVCWGTSTNPTVNDNKTTDGTGTGSFTSSLTGLAVNTTFYVRSYATNETGTVYGNEQSFTTEDGLSSGLTTTAITDITATTATSGGNITDDGGFTITARGVCWSTSTNPTINDNKTTDGTGTGSFISSLTGLAVNTTFYVRSYATNEIGTAYGNEQSFTTEDGLPSGLTTTEVTDITTTTATSGGNISDDGGFVINTRGVCWSTSTNPTIANAHTTNGSGTGSFTSSLTGLAKWSTYYVRAYATNSNGTVYGNEVSFTTIGTPVSDYDGNIYETIKIGSQVWMAENLKTTHYEDGTVINLVEDVTAWSNLSATDKAMCYYDNSTTNKETYGVLYTWAAAMNGAASSTSNPSGVQGVCPDGWHIPSDEEWKEMEMFIGMNQVQADTTGYRGTNEGSKIAGNESLWIYGTLTSNAEFGTVDFIALPGGYRPFTGEFMSLGNLGAFWSSTEHSSASATVRFLNSDYSKICRYGWTKPRGTSIRCIKD